MAPTVWSVVSHTCAFGMASGDEHGKGPVFKQILCLSDSIIILNQVNTQYTGAVNGTYSYVLAGQPEQQYTPGTYAVPYSED